MKIFEKLGIPENLYEVTMQIYNGITTHINNLEEVTPTISFVLPVDDKISDLHLSKCKIRIIIDMLNMSELDPEVSKKYSRGDLIFTGMSVNHTSEKNIPANKIILKSSNVAKIDIKIAAFNSYPSKLKLINFNKINSSEIIKALGHELKHQFDGHKNKVSNIDDKLKYNAYQSVEMPINAISEFLYNLYYTTTVENLVRTSEVYTNMMVNNISKENFKEFLSTDSTYTKLKNISEFSVTKLRDDIKLEMDTVNHIIDDNCEGELFPNDDAKIDRILKFIYVGLCNSQLRDYKKFLTSSLLEEMFGLDSSEKRSLFKEMTKKIIKYENNIDKFYSDIEKMFIFVSNKYMKKISKLYDMSKTNNKSIKNWELHQRINQGKPTFKMESKIIDFETFFRKNK